MMDPKVVELTADVVTIFLLNGNENRTQGMYICGVVVNMLKMFGLRRGTAVHGLTHVYDEGITEVSRRVIAIAPTLSSKEGASSKLRLGCSLCVAFTLKRYFYSTMSVSSV